MITHIVSDWLFSPCCVEHQDEFIFERVAVAYSRDYNEVGRAQIKLVDYMRGSFTVLYFILGGLLPTFTNHFNQGSCNANDGIVIKILCSSLITYFYRNIFIQKAIGQVGMTSLQVNCSLAEVNASVFIAVF